MKYTNLHFLATLSLLTGAANLVSLAPAHADEVFVNCGNYSEANANISLNSAGMQWSGSSLSDLLYASQGGCRVRSVPSSPTIRVGGSSYRVNVDPTPQVEVDPVVPPVTVVNVYPTVYPTRSLW